MSLGHPYVLGQGAPLRNTHGNAQNVWLVPDALAGVRRGAARLEAHFRALPEDTKLGNRSLRIRVDVILLLLPGQDERCRILQHAVAYGHPRGIRLTDAPHLHLVAQK